MILWNRLKQQKQIHKINRHIIVMHQKQICINNKNTINYPNLIIDGVGISGCKKEENIFNSNDHKEVIEREFVCYK